MNLPDPAQLAALLDVCANRGPLHLRAGDFEITIGGQPPVPEQLTDAERARLQSERELEEVMTAFAASPIMPKPIAWTRPK